MVTPMKNNMAAPMKINMVAPMNKREIIPAQHITLQNGREKFKMAASKGN